MTTKLASPKISRLIAIASAAAAVAATNGHFLSDERLKRDIRTLSA